MITVNLQKARVIAHDDAGVAVIVPAPECELTIEQNKY